MNPREMTNAGLAAALREEGKAAVPLSPRRDFVFYPLMFEALARLLMQQRDPLATARDEGRTPRRLPWRVRGLIALGLLLAIAAGAFVALVGR